MADKINVCQNWSVDKEGKKIEPGQCPNWENNTCIFEGTDTFGNTVRARYFPNCNLIGTQAHCDQYAGKDVQARCTLPDPNRHVVNRREGRKWVVPADFDFSAITEYNDGKCDGKGTSTKCAGYSPHHMGFSALTPTKDESIDSTSFTTISGFAMRLPLNFVIYNVRAALSRCFWWQAEVENFTVDSDLTSETFGEVKTVSFQCANPDEIVKSYSGEEGTGFKWDTTLKMFRAPCNGCKPECPRYTSDIGWEYCVDSKLQHGDKVLAEQILEIRHYMRESDWTKESYENAFKDPVIYTWKAKVDYTKNASTGQLEYTIPATRVSFNVGGESFVVSKKDVVLTKGTPKDKKKHYPDLVRELRAAVLTPIILNKFDQIDKKNIFEFTNNLSGDSTMTIFGKSRYYNSLIYGINLSDPDLELSSKLKRYLHEYGSMQEIQIALEKVGVAEFNAFYNEFDCWINWMAIAYPEKLVSGEIGTDSNSFFLDLQFFAGENEVFIFEKGTQSWEYTKTVVNVSYLAGVVGQTSFSIRGEGTVGFLPAYESDFGGYINKNGEIKFTFFPLQSFSSVGGETASALYAYNDSVREELNPNPRVPMLNKSYVFSYRLYEVEPFPAPKIISMEEMRFIGNKGRILITVPDKNKVLHRVFKPWAVESLTLTYPDGTKVEMEVLEQGINKLEPNQLLIKPKNVAEFKSPTPGTNMVLKHIFTYEKRSFGQAVKGDEIDEDFINDDDVVKYTDAAISQSQNNFTLTEFGQEALTIGVVFKGINGRIKGQTKTKMLLWVRQPFCRDVEINYLYLGEYSTHVLTPQFVQYGDWGIESLGPVNRWYQPPCGDHNIHPRSGKGFMWYPYTECDAEERYNVTGVLTEWATGTMDPFKEGVHGAFDMRMLGPVQNFAWTCDSHASLWNCIAEWSFCNGKLNNTICRAMARTRGGVTGMDKYIMLRNSGDPPKFGNVHRDFLRSYRSMDNIDYYRPFGRTFTRRRKWVPVSEFYSSANITQSAYGYPYKLYCSSDYYDDNSPFTHPMGAMLAPSIDGVAIGETLYDDEENRYDFDELFYTNLTPNIYYPAALNTVIKGQITPIIMTSWHSYRDSPTGEGSIQWVWQEIQPKLERGKADVRSMVCDPLTTACCTKSTITGDCAITAPYYTDNCKDEIPYGRHLFFDIQYPDYKYDDELAEHRLVSAEGNYTVNVIPPNFAYFGGEVSTFFWAMMSSDLSGDGPYRAFNLDGEWDPPGSETSNPYGGTENEYYDLYTTCTASPWEEDVTLFADAAAEANVVLAEDEGRMITVYVDGLEESTYYQRGLNIQLKPGLSDFVAQKLELVSYKKYDLSLSIRPLESSTLFASVSPNLPYPAANKIDATYSTDSTSLILKIHIPANTDIGLISGVECVFKHGFFAGENLYHVPAVSIVGEDGKEKYRCNSMTIGVHNEYELRRCSYIWNVSARDIVELETSRALGGVESRSIEITFRLSPTLAEIDPIKQYYSKYKHKVNIQDVYIYHSEFVESTEEIKVFERKYKVSIGDHGDIPPHGTGDTGGLLYPLTYDRSSVYQRDSQGGMVGAPNSAGNLTSINKCRGRIMFEVHEDQEVLEIGSRGDIAWLHEAEKQQKIIHDKIANEGRTSFTMKSVVPPGVKDVLDKIGITYPSWKCEFTNTLIRPLTPVISYPLFNAKGHLFEQSYEFGKKGESCGTHGAVFGRIYADTFRVVYVDQDTKILILEVDIVVAYVNRARGQLIDPMMYLEPGVIRFAGEAQAYIEGVKRLETMEFRESADPLN